VEAWQFVTELVMFGDHQVTFTSHSLDKYGRPLGHVKLADGRILNTLILDAGHAVPM
jgi:endonuclease YncB( thermonuclease family)